MEYLKLFGKGVKMNRQEFENIFKEQTESKNLPNSRLVEMLDVLSNEFETTKQNLINLSFYLDSVEELYNKILKEYQNRTK